MAVALMGLAACDRGEEPVPVPAAEEEPAILEEEEAEAAPGPEPTGASIIRPEIALEPVIDVPPQPLEATVSFADGGSALSESAMEGLRLVLDSAPLEEGWPVILRGHTDSTGGDRANLAVSRRRAQSVADWLIEHGVDEARLSIIALGEQRPVAPNANLDGSPDEEGRAQNRRVTVTIAPPAAIPGEEQEIDAETTDETAQEG